MSAGYAPCSCSEAEALKARVRELESLLEAAAAELDRRDEHLCDLRTLLADTLAVHRHHALRFGIDARISAALKETP